MDARKDIDHTTFQEWLDLDLENELDAPRRERLEAHLASCAECREERRSLEALTALLAESRVPVHPELRATVAASLPVAGWEARGLKAWRLPLALLALLGVIAAGLVGVTSAQMQPDASFVGALAAVGDLFATALLAGAGLLAASWKGVGLVTAEALSRTPGGVAVFAVLVVCCNLLLLSLLRRRSVAAKEPAEGSRRR